MTTTEAFADIHKRLEKELDTSTLNGLVNQLAVGMVKAMPYPPIKTVWAEDGTKQLALAQQVYNNLSNKKELKAIGETIHQTFRNDFDGAGLLFMRIIYYVVNVVVNRFDATFCPSAHSWAYMRTRISRAWDNVGDWKH